LLIYHRLPLYISLLIFWIWTLLPLGFDAPVQLILLITFAVTLPYRKPS